MLGWLKIIPKNCWIFFDQTHHPPKECLCGKSKLASVTCLSLPFFILLEVVQSATSSHLRDKKFRTHMVNQVLWKILALGHQFCPLC